ncbi:MAG: MFS transporter, partial [Chloroflexota bacterium]|nr:MFS transporter [Chloroflexota bacterium]
MIARLAAKAGWAASLQFRDFRFLWASTVFYSLSTGMERVAVGWLVFDLTGSPFMLGVAAAARMAPFFFLGILSGSIADWLERRTLLWFSTLGGILVSSVMAAMLLSGATHVWAVIGL